MKKQIDLVGVESGGVRLRALRFDDLPLTLVWRTHERVRRQFWHTDVVGAAEHIAWFRQYAERSDDYVFIGEVDETAVGQVSIYDVKGVRAEFGRLIVGTRWLGLGYGLALTKAAIEVARRLGVTNLYLSVRPENTKAIHIYQKAGFVTTAMAPDRIEMEITIDG